MTFLRRLRDRPHLLELAYSANRWLMRPFTRWMKPGGWMERVLIPVEKLSKGSIFDCRMCGQCVLHHTGMTCPMTCPKEMRNGPCGGVRPDGRCEVKPEMACIWAEAWERSKRMPTYGGEFLDVQAPLDRALMDTSAWVNDFSGVIEKIEVSWQE